jgi:hypothetical protein
MPGMIPGPIGFAAFVGVKFGGYTLAGTVLQRNYPAEDARPVKIAITRTAVGLVLGIAHFFVWESVQRKYFNGSMSEYSFIGGLIVLRLLIWSGIIWRFCDRKLEHPIRVLGWAAAGTAFSFLLDVIGIALALVTPGQMPMC